MCEGGRGGGGGGVCDVSPPPPLPPHTKRSIKDACFEIQHFSIERCLNLYQSNEHFIGCSCRGEVSGVAS